MLSLALSLVVALSPVEQEAKTFTGKIEKSVSVNYLIALPEGYDQKRKERWPLVLFLHGAGERGADLEKLKVNGPPKLIASGRAIPAIVVSPQCPDRQWWGPQVLAALLDSLEKSYKVDKNRILVTGLSMGGFGTWALAAHQPKRFAAIAPICGGGEPSAAASIAHIPTWVVHGDRDMTVPLIASSSMVKALEAAGAKPKFEVIQGGGHDVWTQTYDRADFWEWLLAQRRK